MFPAVALINESQQMCLDSFFLLAALQEEGGSNQIKVCLALYLNCLVLSQYELGQLVIKFKM